MFAGMSANEDNKDDPIDSAITKTFNAMDEAPVRATSHRRDARHWEVVRA